MREADQHIVSSLQAARQSRAQGGSAAFHARPAFSQSEWLTPKQGCFKCCARLCERCPQGVHQVEAGQQHASCQVTMMFLLVKTFTLCTTVTTTLTNQQLDCERLSDTVYKQFWQVSQLIVFEELQCEKDYILKHTRLMYSKVSLACEHASFTVLTPYSSVCKRNSIAKQRPSKISRARPCKQFDGVKYSLISYSSP